MTTTSLGGGNFASPRSCGRKCRLILKGLGEVGGMACGVFLAAGGILCGGIVGGLLEMGRYLYRYQRVGISSGVAARLFVHGFIRGAIGAAVGRLFKVLKPLLSRIIGPALRRLGVPLSVRRMTTMIYGGVHRQIGRHRTIYGNS